MTKEELTRIESAYYSGLKVQIWFNGYWQDFDNREYPNGGFSERRLYRIVGSGYAEKAEKRITELEKENAELKERIADEKLYLKQKKINKELVDEKDELQKSLREALLIIEQVYQVPVMQISAHSFPKPKLMSEIEEFLKKNGKL